LIFYCKVKLYLFLIDYLGANKYILEDHPYRPRNDKAIYPFGNTGIRIEVNRFVIKLFSNFNWDVDYDIYYTNPSGIVGNGKITRKWYMGIGASIGQSF
jgi:hypothetical protein